MHLKQVKFILYKCKSDVYMTSTTGNNLQDFSGDSLLEKVKLMMQSLTLQR